jgi:hypothetical protein
LTPVDERPAGLTDTVALFGATSRMLTVARARSLRSWFDWLTLSAMTVANFSLLLTIVLDEYVATTCPFAIVKMRYWLPNGAGSPPRIEPPAESTQKPLLG